MPEKQSQDPSEILALTVQEFHAAMAEFNGAMQKREEFALRIARRTTQIIRFSLFALLVVATALFFLIHTLTENLSEITNHTRAMSRDFTEVARDIANMYQTMGRMDLSMQQITLNTNVMQQSIQYLPGMAQSVLVLSEDLGSIRKDMSGLQHNVGAIRNDIARIDQGLFHLNNQMGGLSHDVDSMASPFQFFPFR